MWRVPPWSWGVASRGESYHNSQEAPQLWGPSPCLWVWIILVVSCPPPPSLAAGALSSSAFLTIFALVWIILLERSISVTGLTRQSAEWEGRRQWLRWCPLRQSSFKRETGTPTPTPLPNSPSASSLLLWDCLKNLPHWTVRLFPVVRKQIELAM